MQSLSDGGGDLILNYGLFIGGLGMVYICGVRHTHSILLVTILNQMHNKESYLRQPAQKRLRIDSGLSLGLSIKRIHIGKKS